MKVLLLNPPAPRKILRDQYCSHTSKAGYYWTPVDLLYQSGIVAAEHEVVVIDAVVEGLSPESAMKRILTLRPDAIIALSSVLTARADLDFLGDCKKRLGCKVILMGDLFYFNAPLMIRHDTIDAICLQYPSHGVMNFLRGEAIDKGAEDLIFKTTEGEIRTGPFSKGPVSYPTPKHFAFPMPKYRSPIEVHSPCFQVATNFGCPFQCSYCNSNPVPFRERNFDELFAELDFIHSRGARQIWFHDYMFNADLKRAKAICREMTRRKYKFRWFTDVRPDRVDGELFEAMREAGCHTVMMGVESGNEGILNANNRRTGLAQVRDAFAEAHRNDLGTLGHFMLGLPGETKATARESIRFLRTLDCDLVSLNIFAPRCGSKYAPRYNTVEEALRPQPELDSVVTSRSYCELSPAELRRLKRFAHWSFYLRPKLVARLLAKANTPLQLRRYFVSGARLLGQR